MAAPPNINKVSYETLFQTAIETSEIEALDEIESTLADVIRRETLENDERIKNAEPFCYLGEVMENRAAKTNVEIGQRQRFLLQAAALYNFVRNYVIKNKDEHDLLEIVQAAIKRVRASLATSMERNVDGCSSKSEVYKSELQEIRDTARSFLERMENENVNKTMNANTEEEIQKTYIEQQVQVKKLLETISSRIKRLLSGIIQDCLEILGEAPCHYEVMVLGSLARGEMTPYSDLEWAILTSSEEEEFKTFFRNLTNLIHLEVINLGETILPSMNIRVLGGGWFYDDITPRGVSFDGLLPQACKTPLGNFLVGNMQRFELIRSPTNMVAYQSDDWYKVNPGLAEILLTVAPLSSDNHRLVDGYVNLLREFLNKPCDLEDCHHDSSGDLCSIRKCRSTRSLRKDVTKYGEFSFASKQKFDGKLYDVKKDIYRLTDRAIAGLGSCFDIASNGAFAVLDELLEQGKIGPTARENLGSAVGIALKLRVDTYLRAGKQGEVMRKNDARDGGVTWVYRLPNEHELFHYFYVATPLYEKMYRFFNDGVVRQSLDVSEEEFCDKSESVKGDLFCRLSNYDEAHKCYQLAFEGDPGDVLLKVKLLRVEFIQTSTLDVCKLDSLLRELSQKYNPDGAEENQEVSELQYFGSDLDLMDVRLLVEMLCWLSMLCELIENFAVAKNVLSQCMNAMEGTLGFDREGFGMLLTEAYLQRICASLCSNSSDAHERSQLIIPRLESFIEREGASMRSLQILHELAEMLYKGEQYDEAYRWLKYGLSVGRDLYGQNVNFKILMTLILLVKVCDKLNRHEEGERYSLMFKQYKLNN